MKKIFILILAASLFACNSKEKSMGGGTKDSTGMSTTTTEAQPAMDTKGYSLTYPVTYTIAPNKNAEQILTLWKGWEENNLDVAKEIFADSVSLYFADGSKLVGARDSLINEAKGARNSMGTIKSTVHTIMAVTSSMGDDYVNVWGLEARTNNGKTDSVSVHEVWRFNKSGKVDLLYQFEAKPAM